MTAVTPGFIGTEVDEICADILAKIERRIVCDGISIFEISHPPATLRFAATKTIVRDQLKDLKLRLGQGIAGAAAESREAVICNDVSADSRFHSLPDRVFRFTTRSVLCSPMLQGSTLVGVVELVNKADNEAFTEVEQQALQRLATVVAAEWADEEIAARRSTFDRLVLHAIDIVDVEGVSVLTLQEDGATLVFRRSYTVIKTSLEGVRLNIGQGIAGHVAKELQPIFVEDVQQDRRFFQGVDATSPFKSRSILAVPVLVAEQPRAVVEVINSQQSEALTHQDLEQLQLLSGELAGRLAALISRS